MKLKKIENKSQGRLKNITYILIIAIIIILFFTGYSIGKGINQIIVKGSTQIAEPIIEIKSNPKIDITTNEKEGTYTFYVRNFDEKNKISESKIQYKLKIQDDIDQNSKNTIKYEMYKNGKLIDLKNQETEYMELTNTSKQNDKYELKIKYVHDSNLTLSEIVGRVQIKIHSQQLIV